MPLPLRTGDTTYGTTPNLVANAHAGIRASRPLPDFEHWTRCFGRERFTYEAERDVDRCPGDQELRFRKPKHTERTWGYQAPAAACNARSRKAHCTTSAKPRHVKRSFDEAYLDRVRRFPATKTLAKARRKRQVWVAPLVAEGKAWHGLDCFRLRGLLRCHPRAGRTNASGCSVLSPPSPFQQAGLPCEHNIVPAS